MKTVVPVPTINANDEFVVIVRWQVAPGAAVAAGAPLVDVETTKAVVTIESESAGWVQPRCREGDEVRLGADLAWLYSTAAEWEEDAARGGGAGSAPTEPRPATTAAATGAAREAATLAASVPAGPSQAPARGAAAPADLDEPFTVTRLSPAAAAWVGEGGVQQLGAMRGLVTRRSLEGRGSAVRADGLRRERIPAAKRAEIQALREGAGEHLRSSLTVYFDSAPLREAAPEESVLPVILAEVAALLPSQPRFTAFYDDGRIAFHDAVHLGVALDLGAGLRVVTLRDATGRSAGELAGRLGELALAYQENRLGPAEVQGATFTVTDLSGFDVLQFEPLVNARQSAILAVGGDATLPGHPMSLTLAFDHRVANGREAAEFLQALRDRLVARGRAVAVGAPNPVAGTPSLAPAAPACDRCLTELSAYYAKYGRWGVMHQYLRPDGSPGLICHACLAVS